MTSDEKTLNTKFDHLSKIKLLHRSFSHWRNFYQTLVTNSWISYTLSETMSHTCEIWSTFYSNFLKWKNGLYKHCRSWWDEQTWYSKLFNLRQSGSRKLICRRQNLKITNWNHPNFLKWKVDQNNNCRYWWV